MTQSFLFVGGPADGKRIALQLDSKGHPPREHLVEKAVPIDDASYRREVFYYRCEMFRDQAGDYRVYVCDSVKESPMAALINGYRKAAA